MAANLIVVILMLISLLIPNSNARKEGAKEELAWLQNICCTGNEKVVKLHFFLQDVQAGINETVFEVARASISANSPSNFGLVRVLDDLVTAGPEKDSEKLGRAQGTITYIDLETSALGMNLNIVFTAGPYSGSTLCILGRNPITVDQRELPVVGGTGIFRMARGYVIGNTYDYDTYTEYGVLEYNAYVSYFDDSSIRTLQGDQ
ncbi:dirigent protein 22-like [Henckelia pumila]|uniref:dirigent protein 22-like n=1 Tax=Henckelia pumila TaxID=405737 RepID=UPI003C6DFF33